jgi:hypothetical protein
MAVLPYDLKSTLFLRADDSAEYRHWFGVEWERKVAALASHDEFLKSHRAQGLFKVRSCAAY